MKISQSIELIKTTNPRRNFIIGWNIVIFLSLLELLAVLYGKPSILKSSPALIAFVDAVGEWIPVVQFFGRCAARFNAGSGLMLALNAVFFPVKLVALHYAYPQKIANPDKGWRGVFGVFYMFLIALVALLPALIFYVGWGNSASESSLASIQYKFSALCFGGWRGFAVSMMQSGFGLLCAYVALAIFIGIFRSQHGMVKAVR